MPRISVIYGIVIAMYYEEHGRPHFCARYAEFDVSMPSTRSRSWRGNYRRTGWRWFADGQGSIAMSSQGFEDGVEGEIDFSDRSWRGVFEPLGDPSYFRQVELDRELGTIVWPNGADMAPETLHDRVLGMAQK
jgi:hypothetical protein